MSYDYHEAGHSSARSCCDLLEVLADRYNPREVKGVDVAGAARAVQKFIAQGLITVAKPIADYARFEKHKHYLTREQKQAVTRAQMLASIRDEQRLDRVVSEVKNMGELPHGELARIASARGVDYRKLLNRVRGKTKTSRLT